MLKLLTTDEFAAWFDALDDGEAEDVATAIDVVEHLGPEKAPPESREALLWYEHPSVTQFTTAVVGKGVRSSLAWDLEAWGSFRDYAKKVLDVLESRRFVKRLSELETQKAVEVLEAIRLIKRGTDPRVRWSLKLASADEGRVGPSQQQHEKSALPRPEDACAEVRRLYFAALASAGFEMEDVPAHSLALRELARRTPNRAFRLLYGVDVEREVALFVLGEWLDRSFYGDSVRRAEKAWKQFLAGTLSVSDQSAAAVAAASNKRGATTL